MRKGPERWFLRPLLINLLFIYAMFKGFAFEGRIGEDATRKEVDKADAESYYWSDIDQA